MKFIRFNLVVYFLLVFCFFLKAQTAEPPRLVVGIMVDGLQKKHLDMLSAYFDPGGFKKLTESGISIQHVNYNIISGGNASDIATVMTGSVPFYHGITGNKYYNRSTDKIRQYIYDEQEIGIGTPETYSAYSLLASTFSDELKLATNRKSKIYVAAINANEAMMLGGHTANSVAWIDDIQHKWVTTGYYKDGLSKSADNMNVSGAFKTISSLRWQPLYAANTYMSAANDSKKSDFTNQPTERKSKTTSNTWLKNTPSANSLVAELGIRIVNDEQLGQDNTPDMLLLQFSVRAPNEKFFSLQSVEKEDMYLRLDKEIQNLLQKIDVKVGMDKTLVYLFANQTEVHSPTELGDNNIPAGYFSANRSMALLNTYLMAMFGQERWVTGYYGKNIFLNKQKIEEKKLNFADFQKLVADFMPEFEGIQTAYPSTQILTMGGDSNSEIARLRNSTHKSSMGDVVITLMPGWLELDDDYKPVGESNALTSITPLFFYGMKLKPSKVNSSYSVTDIAPTLSRILNIPLPNACIGKPIKEIFE